MGGRNVETDGWRRPEDGEQRHGIDEPEKQEEVWLRPSSAALSRVLASQTRPSLARAVGLTAERKRADTVGLPEVSGIARV